MCGPKFCSMKITQDLRAEVLAMSEEQRAAIAETAAQSEHARLQGMADKSAEFLEKGGKLYVEAAE
jgi:phosphomethylpyrimidine synthase